MVMGSWKSLRGLSLACFMLLATTMKLSVGVPDPIETDDEDEADPVPQPGGIEKA